MPLLHNHYDGFESGPRDGYNDPEKGDSNPNLRDFEPGGLSLGLAFLSDLQVQMALEAAQSDSRSNVMQAPKLKMFNGQSAGLRVQDKPTNPSKD